MRTKPKSVFVGKYKISSSEKKQTLKEFDILKSAKKSEFLSQIESSSRKPITFFEAE